jgi:diacylglycerol kinase
MKNKTFLQSLKCASRGLIDAIKSEKNFKRYVLHILITVPINIFIGCSISQWVAYLICITGVFATECMNTSIEQLCNLLINEYNEKIKFIKDVAAGAVWCWGLCFYAMEIIFVGGALIA